MDEHICSHPTCYESDKTATIYKEPTEHNDKGWFPACSEHVDMSKDGITVLLTENSGAAQVANAEILTALQEAEAELEG